jgi:hypothetical protein
MITRRRTLEAELRFIRMSHDGERPRKQLMTETSGELM